MSSRIAPVLLSSLLLAAASCGGEDTTTPAPASNAPSAPADAGKPGTPPHTPPGGIGSVVGAAAAAPLATTPKTVIAHQLELLKAGDVEGLKACVTERLRDKVTQEAVEKAKANVSQVTIDELVDSVEEGTDGGHRTMKIRMKNGRTLTTLVETGGKWLADTIWFK